MYVQSGVLVADEDGECVGSAERGHRVHGPVDETAVGGDGDRTAVEGSPDDRVGQFVSVGVLDAHVAGYHHLTVDGEALGVRQRVGHGAGGGVEELPAHPGEQSPRRRVRGRSGCTGGERPEHRVDHAGDEVLDVGQPGAQVERRGPRPPGGHLGVDHGRRGRRCVGHGDGGGGAPLAGGRRVTLDERHRYRVNVGHSSADLVDGCGLRSAPGRGRRVVGSVDVAGDVGAPGVVGFPGLLDVRRIRTDVGHVFGERRLLDGARIIGLVIDGGHVLGDIRVGLVGDLIVEGVVGDLIVEGVVGEVMVDVVVCGVGVVGLTPGVPGRPGIRR